MLLCLWFNILDSFAVNLYMHERRSVAATMLSLYLSIFYLCGNNMALCSALTLHWQRAWPNVTSSAMLYRYIFIIHTIYCVFAGNSQSVGIYKSYPPTNIGRSVYTKTTTTPWRWIVFVVCVLCFIRFIG